MKRGIGLIVGKGGGGVDIGERGNRIDSGGGGEMGLMMGNREGGWG